MNNSGPVSQSAGPLFLTIDPPAGTNGLLLSLTGDSLSHVRATDPISAAAQGLKDWYGTTAATPAGTDAGSPWFKRVSVVALAVVLVAIGVYVAVK